LYFFAALAFFGFLLVFLVSRFVRFLRMALRFFVGAARFFVFAFDLFGSFLLATFRFALVRFSFVLSLLVGTCRNFGAFLCCLPFDFLSFVSSFDLLTGAFGFYPALSREMSTQRLGAGADRRAADFDGVAGLRHRTEGMSSRGPFDDLPELA
jgi:hypothetical protein